MSGDELGAGPAVGIALACLFIVICIVLLSLFLLRRRQRKRTPRNLPPSRADTVSTIAFGGDTLSRHMTNGVRPPPYNTEQVANGDVGGAPGSEQSEEAPPPYDSVLKDQQRRTANTPQQQQQVPPPNHVTIEDDSQDVLQQSWQATAMPHRLQHQPAAPVAAADRSTRSMPSAQRRRAGSMPQARRHRVDNTSSSSSLHECMYVPRKYVPDPTENPGRFQRSQSMFPERTRPLPRPPGTYAVYPPRSISNGRIKLGTHALQSRGGVRNYMNQGIHSECDSDSTVTNTDHIYETLNLPSDTDSRCGSLHALNQQRAPAASTTHSNSLSPNSVSSHSNHGHMDGGGGSHVRQASCASDTVFEPDSGINSSEASYSDNNNRHGAHLYGPGYRHSSAHSTPYRAAGGPDQLSNTHARMLYPNNAYHNNYGRDKSSVLYRPSNQKRAPGSQHHRHAHNHVDKYKQPKLYSPHTSNYSAMNGNAMPMQYLGPTQANSVHSNASSIDSTSLSHNMQATPLIHNNKTTAPAHAHHLQSHGGHQNASYVGQSPAAGAHSHPQTGNSVMFRPVNDNRLSPPPTTTLASSKWPQSPATHDTATTPGDAATLSLRDLPTPDSQSNLIPSSNNSSFDQTPQSQQSVVFLTDAETLLMSPTSV